MLFSTLLALSLVRAVALNSGPEPRNIRGVPVQRMSLYKDPSSPYCFVVSSVGALDPYSNFLATQVWPSARLAAAAVREHAAKQWTVCEFGCGPGMPSLTAAALGCNVMATDFDDLALELVQEAAEEQGRDVVTRKFDLVADSDNTEAMSLIQQIMGKEIDLVIFSDVFENDSVARGAAKVTKYFLDRGSRVWTFAQSDRVQREAYVAALNSQGRGGNHLAFATNPYNADEKLWLCDLDETKVVYG